MKKSLMPLPLRQRFLMLGVAAAVIAVMAFGIFHAAKAIGNGALAIQPHEWDPSNPLTKSWFIYALDPGQARQDKVDIINLSDEPKRVEVYPVDAVVTKDGAFALKEKAEEQNDVGTWISLPVSEVELGPKEVKTLDFTIQVPANAEVGDHAGGIIITEIAPPAELEGTGIQVVARLGARVYITVSGEPVSFLKLTEIARFIKDGKLTIVLSLENQGNTKLEPVADFVVTSLLGKIVAEKKGVSLGLLLPDSKTTNALAVVEKLPRIGRLSVDILLRYDDRTVPSTLTYWIIPWGWVTFVAALVILLAAGVVALVKRRAKKRGK